MLVQIEQKNQFATRNLRRERRLWHDSMHQTPAMGCGICPEFKICGGLTIKEPAFDCLGFCCNNPGNCDKVCRNSPDFASRVREISTFDFQTVPRTSVGTGSILPKVIPLVFHASGRTLPIALPAVALPLYAMFTRRHGIVRFTAPRELYSAFLVAAGTTIVLSGIDRDAPLERWWELGERQRRTVIRALRQLGVALVTSPNYSLFTDVPRWDDLHAMKRIALIHHEFVSEGMPCALHVNGRTEMDFRRWIKYVAERPEITHLAYEFTTGTAWAGRRERHAEWLCELAAAVNRPLHLTIRGGVEVLPLLNTAFANVTFLETNTFIKTINRQKAMPNGESSLRWFAAPTPAAAPLDALFAENMITVHGWLHGIIGRSLSQAQNGGR